MEIKKNDCFTVSIEDMSEDGSGIGKLDGYIWFIKDAVKGDVVEAKAMKMKKSYGFARSPQWQFPAEKSTSFFHNEGRCESGFFAPV